MNKSDKSKLVFLVGNPRSASLVTLASLDWHPNILVWPFELFYFPFFNEISNRSKVASLIDLNHGLRKLFYVRMNKMEIIFFSFNKAFVESKMKHFPYQIINKSFYKPYGRKCLSLLYNLRHMDIKRDLQRRILGKVY